MWYLIHLLVAINTELYSDEAYYWMYSQFPDWGYFDHPPGVGTMIWFGGWLGKSEFAVRFVNLIFSAATVGLLYWLVKPKNVHLFFITVFSFLSLHLIGVAALPDTPFLLMAIVFMIAYRAFLQLDSIGNTIFLGVSAVLMLYCKYHGGLVIVLVILSNWRLLLNWKFYLAGIIALFLFLPHVTWQVQNNFPSFQYHLIDRASPEYKASHTLDYLFGNLPFLGGFIAVILFIATFYKKPSDKFEKALQFNLYGTFIFFMLITFKAQYIEANWTIFCILPILYFGYRVIENVKWVKFYWGMAIFSAALMFLFLVHMVNPLVVIKKDRVWDFHGGEAYVEEILALTGDKLVAANRYQDASLINFYGNLDYFVSALNINSRDNQYSIWKFDEAVCDESILFVNGGLGDQLVNARNFKNVPVSTVSNFTSLRSYDVLLTDLHYVNGDLVLDCHLSKNCYNESSAELKVYVATGDGIVNKNFLVKELSANENSLSLGRITDVSSVSVKLFSPQLNGEQASIIIY